MAEMTAAESYEQFLVPNVFGPWAQLVLAASALQPGQRVLDAACGSGIAARLAAAAVGSGGAVIGTDIDEGMLAVARRTATRDGAAAIDWQRADAMDLPFPNASFDAVLCFEGLQFFPDRTKGLAEFRRVLKPHGHLIGTVWGPLEENPGYHALAEGLARFVSPDAGRLPPFMLADCAAIQSLLAEAGFAGIEVEPRRIMRPVPSVRAFIEWVASGAPTTRHKLSLLADSDREAFARFVEQRLEPCRQEGVLQMPYMRHVFAASVP